MLQSPLIFIIAICRIVQSAQGPITVFVRKDQNETRAVDGATTVGDLMDAVNQMWPRDYPRSLGLSFGGNSSLTDPDQTLADVGIGAEQTVDATFAASTFQLQFIPRPETPAPAKTVILDFDRDIVEQLTDQGLHISKVVEKGTYWDGRLLRQNYGLRFFRNVTLSIIAECDTGDLAEIDDDYVLLVEHRRGFFAAKPGKNLQIRVMDDLDYNYNADLPVGYVVAWDLDEPVQNNSSRRLV